MRNEPKIHLRLLGGKRIACGNHAIYNKSTNRLSDITCQKCLNSHLYKRLRAEQDVWYALRQREDTLREELFKGYDTIN